jgi:hypothetical protein
VTGDEWQVKKFAFAAVFQTRHSSLVTRHFLHYCQRLKALSIAFFMLTALFLGGCADPLEKPLGQEAGEKFKRGIRGEGTLVPIDRTDDPYIQERH